MRNWLAHAPSWLTPRRIRAHATLLAVCLWGVCVVDYATPGVFDRAGNIKFQDFLLFSVSARRIEQGRLGDLYNDQVLADSIRMITGRPTTVSLQYFYGPQVALPFLPLVRFSFLEQAAIWVFISLLLYFGCIYLLSRTCPELQRYSPLVAICAVAYPPLFHFFVRGQLSVVTLVCFTSSYFAFRAQRTWLVGIALGFLVFKPQFLFAIPLVLLLARAWKPFAGLVLSAAAQLTLTLVCFGHEVMRLYFTRLFRSAAALATIERSFSLIQMHSLYSFWDLLIPWPRAVWVMYLLTSFLTIGMAAAIWKSSASVSLRFSALVLAAVLVNPHLFVYDLLALAPALLLLTDWALQNRQRPAASVIGLLLYLAFIVPLVGPLAHWTHIQLSVIVFAAILWSLYRAQLASSESAVV